MEFLVIGIVIAAIAVIGAAALSTVPEVVRVRSMRRPLRRP